MTSFSNIQQTIRGHMMSGHPEKGGAVDRLGVETSWMRNQKEDIENMGFKIG